MTDYSIPRPMERIYRAMPGGLPAPVSNLDIIEVSAKWMADILDDITAGRDLGWVIRGR